MFHFVYFPSFSSCASLKSLQPVEFCIRVQNPKNRFPCLDRRVILKLRVPEHFILFILKDSFTFMILIFTCMVEAKLLAQLTVNQCPHSVAIGFIFFFNQIFLLLLMLVEDTYQQYLVLFNHLPVFFQCCCLAGSNSSNLIERFFGITPSSPVIMDTTINFISGLDWVFSENFCRVSNKDSFSSTSRYVLPSWNANEMSLLLPSSRGNVILLAEKDWKESVAAD